MTTPTTFGKYQLLERINVGGMAEVFRAKAFGAEGFERLLAIKRILPNMAEDEEFINMFIDEARIAVQLNHANVVPIYELGKYNSQYYIAMEFVHGKDLRQLFDRYRKKQETIGVAASAYVISKVCEGLDYAHRKTDPSGRPLNLIHRDVSPQNILVSYEGAVKITDFGIVKAEDRASKTQAGVLKGKFAYMSPEQVRGMDIDHRSDIFAVGILLYEALTGKRLFVGESDFATLEKVRSAEVVPPREHNPKIPEALEHTVLKALAREREERYQWALELHDDLQQFLIEENSVFNASKLSMMLKAEYRADIVQEMERLEEYMRMPPPPARDGHSGASPAPPAPTAEWGDHRSERTMIFESGEAAGTFQPTQVGAPISGMGAPLDEAPPTLLDTGLQEVAVELPPAPPAKPRSILPLVLAGVVSVGLIAALVAMFVGSSKEGALTVTSTPIDTVDVFIDGELIGHKTPLLRPNIKVGEHTLVAKAPGYVDKAYRFELVAGAPAEIEIKMQRQAQEAQSDPQGDAVLEVTSDPPLAAVRIGGVPQASTPASLPIADTTHPVVLEVVKNGYVTKTETVSFNPGERKKLLHVVLTPLGGQGAAGGARASAGAHLYLSSRPPGATIYLGGAEQGQTPKELTNLDPHQSYTLELTREGFRAYEEVIHMNGRDRVTLSVTLQSERRRGVRGAAGATGGATPPCSGTAGKISVMPVGIGDCRVSVGTAHLGVAPIFKKDCPTGHCVVEVKCPGGKHYQTTRTLRAGVEERVIIKAEDWQ